MATTLKVALVTGASSGIGKATTELLATRGFRVFAAARRLDRLEAIRAAHIEPLGLDITEETSIAAAVKHVTDTADRIDVLVNNAGYGVYGTLEGARPHEVRRAFDVNVFGLGALTQAVLPVMRAQQSGTIINLSSMVGKISLPVLGWYAATKHAVEALSDALRMEVRPFGIRVAVIEPGAVNTGFQDLAVGVMDNSEIPEAYQGMVAAFRRLIRNGYATAPGPEVVAQTIVQAATARNPRARYRIGREARMFLPARRLLGDRAFDRLLATQFCSAGRSPTTLDGPRGAQPPGFTSLGE